MIHLTTGLPRNGKTLYTIAYVKKLSEEEGRPVFYSGIEGVTLPWTEIDPEKWHECPVGSIILIDECQRVFRLRGNGSQVPKHVSELETHGHNGLDLFLITQHPMLVESNVRRLVERHWHVSRPNGANRATILGFKGCKENPLQKIEDAERQEWPYPKEIFGLYESAKEHTVRRRISMHVVMMWAAILGTVAVVGYIVWSGKQRLTAEPEIAAKPAATPAMPFTPVSAPATTGSDKRPPMTTAEYLHAHTPRIEGLAYTAPIYDEVTKPEEAPVPVACVTSKSKGCQCWSQQATRLPMPQQLCEQIVKNGFFRAFGPNRDLSRNEEKRAVQPEPQRAQQPETQPVSLAGDFPKLR